MAPVIGLVGAVAVACLSRRVACWRADARRPSGTSAAASGEGVARVESRRGPGRWPVVWADVGGLRCGRWAVGGGLWVVGCGLSRRRICPPAVGSLHAIFSGALCRLALEALSRGSRAAGGLPHRCRCAADKEDAAWSRVDDGAPGDGQCGMQVMVLVVSGSVGDGDGDGDGGGGGGGGGHSLPTHVVGGGSFLPHHLVSGGSFPIFSSTVVPSPSYPSSFHITSSASSCRAAFTIARESFLFPLFPAQPHATVAASQQLPTVAPAHPGRMAYDIMCCSPPHPTCTSRGAVNGQEPRLEPGASPAHHICTAAPHHHGNNLAAASRQQPHHHGNNLAAASASIHARHHDDTATDSRNAGTMTPQLPPVAREQRHRTCLWHHGNDDTATASRTTGTMTPQLPLATRER
ncbi:hypothetical protein PMIN01_06772 [Paraphaeosphaeria minitans]|uniref:Uncharacterized protein n=1 Tax=Paraphaeosphaeria minitans TaxID=565426 RepID=A0A9P6KQP7_9PLEO|nr:hypothetical protein PMIN01_06772 [Paraphaeosphaeria minitans]